MRTGFDNDKYVQLQSQHIRERIASFGDKLYLRSFFIVLYRVQWYS